MGKEIVYCHECGNRILEAEFESGRAAVVLKRNYCGKCSEALKTGTSRVPVAPGPATQAGPRQTRRIPIARTSKRGLKISRAQLIALIAIGAFVLLVLIMFVATRAR